MYKLSWNDDIDLFRVSLQGGGGDRMKLKNAAYLDSGPGPFQFSHEVKRRPGQLTKWISSSKQVGLIAPNNNYNSLNCIVKP